MRKYVIMVFFHVLAFVGKSTLSFGGFWCLRLCNRFSWTFMVHFFVVNLSLVDYFPLLIFFHVQFCHDKKSMVDFGSTCALCMVPCDLSCYLLLIATLEVTFNYLKMLWFTRAPLHYVIIDTICGIAKPCFVSKMLGNS